MKSGIEHQPIASFAAQIEQKLSDSRVKSNIAQKDAPVDEYFTMAKAWVPNIGNLESLNDFIRDFISLLPKFAGENTDIIHYQDNQAYLRFVSAFCSKIGNILPSKNNSEMNHGQMKVFGNLIQNISKLHIAMSTPTPLKDIHNAILGDAINFLILKVMYFSKAQQNNPYLLNHFRHTLSALVDLELSQTLNYKNTLNQELAKELAIQIWSANVLKAKFTEKTIKPIIGILQNYFLLMAHWKNKIPLNELDALFQSVELNITELDIKDWNRLNFIKNIVEIEYKKDGFELPASLVEGIQNTLNQQSLNTKGSFFEKKVFSQIKNAESTLRADYGHIYDVAYFNYQNPLVDGLGLEADIMYQSPNVSVCFQVDGDKYHKYVGSNEKTLRTIARDLVFKENKIPVCVYSDTDNGIQKAKIDFITYIIVPEYEAKVVGIKNALTSLEVESPYASIDHRLLENARTFISASDANIYSYANRFNTLKSKLDVVAKLQAFKNTPEYDKFKSKESYSKRKAKLSNQLIRLESDLESQRVKRSELELRISTVAEKHKVNTLALENSDNKQKMSTGDGGLREFVDTHFKDNARPKGTDNQKARVFHRSIRKFSNETLIQMLLLMGEPTKVERNDGYYQQIAELLVQKLDCLESCNGRVTESKNKSASALNTISNELVDLQNQLIVMNKNILRVEQNLDAINQDLKAIEEELKTPPSKQLLDTAFDIQSLIDEYASVKSQFNSILEEIKLRSDSKSANTINTTRFQNTNQKKQRNHASEQANRYPQAKSSDSAFVPGFNVTCKRQLQNDNKTNGSGQFCTNARPKSLQLTKK